MKKALVMTFVLVLGLGFAGFADGTLSGVWDTDISLYPAASEFGDFIKSFTSGVDVEYTIGGWVFGMDSTFGLAGLTGMEFDADGSLGAFTFSLEIDFDPMVLTATTVSYDVFPCFDTQTPCTSAFQWTTVCEFDSLKWYKKTVSNTYTAGFDDLLAEASVSIAGVDLGALFFLESVENQVSETVGGSLYISKWTGAIQTGGFTYSDPDPCTVTDTTTVGSGWKFSAAGSFGGATLTSLAYFNLSETSTYAENDGYADVFLADHFTKSGTFSLVCNDCIVRFSGFELLLEDVSFACATLKALVAFDCCGFSCVKFLGEDIGLGCCWDLGFDMMVTFCTLTKTVEIEPVITLSNACFTIDAVVDFTHTEAAAFSLEGINIRGIELEYSWNGITFTAETSWDLATNPILGKYGSGSISGPTEIWVLQPDTCYTDVTFLYNEDDDTCVIDTVTVLTPAYLPAVDMDTGVGVWEFVSFPCEKAYAWEKFGIDIDGDSCCGGAFDISAVFYFGDVKELTDLDGVYYFDADADGTYEVSASPDEDLLFYGDGKVDGEDVTVPSITAYSADACVCCPCDNTCSFEVDEVEWTKTYTAIGSNRLFDWLKTDVDVVIGLGANFDLTFGLDVTLWGWEDFTFGFAFTF